MKKSKIVRDEMEWTRKKINLSSDRFHEFSKQRYEEILRKFYYTFSTKNAWNPSYNNYFGQNICFRKDLESEVIESLYMHYSDDDGCYYGDDYVDGIKNKVKKMANQVYVMIAGWLYEGYMDEIAEVLKESDAMSFGSVYIMSKKFDWFIYISEIEDCARLYRLS